MQKRTVIPPPLHHEEPYECIFAFFKAMGENNNLFFTVKEKECKETTYIFADIPQCADDNIGMLFVHKSTENLKKNHTKFCPKCQILRLSFSQVFKEFFIAICLSEPLYQNLCALILVEHIHHTAHGNNLFIGSFWQNKLFLACSGA